MAATLHARVRRPSPAGLLLGILIVVLASGIGLLTPAMRSAGSTASNPMIDQRLIIHPTRTDVRGTLSNGVIVTGYLTPTIPGKNTVQIVVKSGVPRAFQPRTITLKVTMIGMHMTPKWVVLGRAARGYAGSITLPMFGVYRVSIALRTPPGTERGTITVELPLPRL